MHIIVISARHFGSLSTTNSQQKRATILKMWENICLVEAYHYILGINLRSLRKADAFAQAFFSCSLRIFRLGFQKSRESGFKQKPSLLPLLSNFGCQSKY